MFHHLAQPFLPKSHLPMQNRADSRTPNITVNPTKVRELMAHRVNALASRYHMHNFDLKRAMTLLKRLRSDDEVFAERVVAAQEGTTMANDEANAAANVTATTSATAEEEDIATGDLHNSSF